MHAEAYRAIGRYSARSTTTTATRMISTSRAVSTMQPYYPPSRHPNRQRYSAAFSRPPVKVLPAER